METQGYVQVTCEPAEPIGHLHPTSHHFAHISLVETSGHLAVLPRSSRMHSTSISPDDEARRRSHLRPSRRLAGPRCATGSASFTYPLARPPTSHTTAHTAHPGHGQRNHGFPSQKNGQIYESTQNRGRSQNRAYCEMKICGLYPPKYPKVRGKASVARQRGFTRELATIIRQFIRQPHSARADF